MDEPKSIPLSLDYVQPLFIEDRPINTWWPRGFSILRIFLLIVALAEASLAYEYWYRLPLFARLALLAAILIFVLINLFFSYSRAITVLEPAALQMRLSLAGFTVWKRTIQLADIRSVEEIKNDDVRSVLRFQFDLTQFMTGLTNVRVKVEKYAYVIGSANPTELHEQLRNALAKLSQ